MRRLSVVTESLLVKVKLHTKVVKEVNHWICFALILREKIQNKFATEICFADLRLVLAFNNLKVSTSCFRLLEKILYYSLGYYAQPLQKYVDE